MKYFLKKALIFSFGIFFFGDFYDLAKSDFRPENLSPSKERDIFTIMGDETNQKDGLPSTPMELMKLLQNSSSMDDATSPSDAIDQALKLFSDQESEDSSLINN